MQNEPRIKEVKRRFSEEPLLFEIIPPEKGAEPEVLDRRINKLKELTARVEVDGINLPEVREESAKSDEGERKSDFAPRVAPREYAHQLSEHLETEYVICRVIVHDSARNQEKWFLETANEYGIHNLVLVGGEKEADAYDGLSVPEGDSLIKEKLNYGETELVNEKQPATDYLIGNICIPTRRLEILDEPQRISYKVKAGTDFFTTQILQEAESTVTLLKDLEEELQQEKLSPPMFFWSFAPIAKQKDVNFMRWLGVKIPDEVEEKILGSDTPVEASIDHAKNIWSRIQKTNEELSISIPMGINISFTGMRNIDNAIKLAEEMRKV